MLEQILRRSAPTPTHFDFETEFTPVGLRTPLPTQVVSAPLSDDRGRLRGVTVVFIDLTERKRMESALRQAERLEALNQAAAGIAHEIRNPIASIRASAQELLEHRGLESTGDTPQRQAVRARLLRVLILESDRLNHIVSDFMTYARIRPPADEPIALAEVLEHVVTVLEQQASPAPPTSEQPEAVRRSATGDGYKITCTCPPDLLVVGDREQLVQVFLNLGLNSLQAMPAGGPVRFVAEVEGSAAPAGREPRVVVSVSDDGPGIDRDAIQRIFEPFFTTKTKGTGMGLPVVKRIVEAHGGRVTVESRESAAGGSAGHEGARGAVFRVELPGAVRGRTSRRQRRQQSTGVSP